MSKQKLTKNQLRKIIREEAEKLDEIGGQGGEFIMLDALEKAMRRTENAQSLLGQFLGQNAMDARNPDMSTRAGQKANAAMQDLTNAVDSLYELREAVEEINQAR